MRAVDGTCVFVDVSGFTKLSERLARRGGREGAEQLADAIGGCFERLLGVAYGKGGGLLKFGGDALLLLFDGDAHLERACASAVAMGQRLRELGPIETGSAPVTLRMSVGVHSAQYLLFAVGSSHRELLISGPAATEVVRMEKEAGTGEIVVSAATAAALPAHCVGAARGAGRLLRSAPPVLRTFEAPLPDTIDASQAPVALPTELRAHVLAGPQPPEHRIVTVAFLRFEGTDALVAAARPRRRRRDAARARHARAGGGRRRAGLLPRLRHRRGRRQADPHRGRPAGARRRGRAHAADAAAHHRRRAAAAAAHRHDARAAVRRRHRPALPADVHRHGRRRQPRRAADGQGAARRALHDAGGAGAIEHAVRVHAAGALHRQGQGAARRGGLRRPRRAQPRRRARRGAGAVPAGRPRARARADLAGARRRAAAGAGA